MRSVIRAPSVRGGIHKTAKPVELLQHLILTSCPPGGVVGDFFAGSGAGGEAAMLAGRSYIGAEIDGAMALKAQARLGDCSTAPS
jgi:site-specific DNA-methyltransferase (adenine-specific)